MHTSNIREHYYTNLNYIVRHVPVSPPHRLYINHAVRHDYSSSGLHQLYCSYVVHPDAPSRRSTSRWSAALALAVRPVTAFRCATT
jgi:hypothetical protein